MTPEGLAYFLHKNHLYRFFVCPECGHVAKTSENLGTHIERHRPPDSLDGKKTRFCPKGCGRSFRFNYRKGEPISYREHAKLCDGRPPLAEGPYPSPKIAIDFLSCLQIAVRLARMEKGQIKSRGGRPRLGPKSGPGDPTARQALVRWFLHGNSGGDWDGLHGLGRRIGGFEDDEGGEEVLDFPQEKIPLARKRG